VVMPAAVRRASALPEAIARLVTTAMSGPGTTVNRASTPAAAAVCVHMGISLVRHDHIRRVRTITIERALGSRGEAAQTAQSLQRHRPGTEWSVDPRLVQLQPKAVLPVQTAADRLGGLSRRTTPGDPMSAAAA
jgi:hypothetical protein